MFFSCRKDTCEDFYNQTASYNTIYPSPYLPAYPGSWWEYNDSVVIKTYDHWQPFNYQKLIPFNKCKVAEYDSVLVPAIDLFSDKFLYHDRYIEQNKYCRGVQSIDLLFNEEDLTWQSWTDPDACYSNASGSHYSIRKNIKTLDTITINGMLFNDVLVISEDHRASFSANIFSTALTTYYYAKNVGIIKEDYVPRDTVQSHPYSLEITDYYIAQ